MHFFLNLHGLKACINIHNKHIKYINIYVDLFRVERWIIQGYILCRGSAEGEK